MGISGKVRRRADNAKRSVAQSRIVLERCSLLYLFVPWFLFLLGWLRPVYSFPCCILLLLGLQQTTQRGRAATAPEALSPSHTAAQEKRRHREYPWSRLLLSAVIALTIALLSGIGGFGPQFDHDFQKHNAFLRDLVEQPWPLWYAQTGPENTPGFLVTYVAVYLPAALVGKVFGWTAANWALVLWVATGTLLASQWFLRLVGTPSLVYVVLLLCFGGMDLLGWLVISAWPQVLKAMAHAPYLDWWTLHAVRGAAGPVCGNYFLLYSSNTTLLSIGFHHALPGWIVVLMFLHEALRRRSATRLGLLWAAAPIGSAFVALGMTPFVVLAAWQTRLRGACNFVTFVVSPMLLLVASLFFLSNDGRFVYGWLWEFHKPLSSWPYLLLVFLLEFGVYAVFCPVRFDDESWRPWRAWWTLALLCLIAFPLYRVGKACDFPAKGIIPALLTLQVILAASTARAKSVWREPRMRLFVLLLLIGCAGGIHTIARHAAAGIQFTPVALEEVPHVNELEPRDIAPQLFSEGDAFFWRVLARRPSGTPLLEAPAARD